VKKRDRNGQRPAVAIVGPTASGKTAVALHVAGALGTEIISVDSRQIYRRLDIGTAKPTPEEIRRVRHHLVDFVEPRENYSVGQYRRAVEALVPRFEDAGMVPLFVGGTGLYLKAVLEGLCPAPPANSDLRQWLKRASRFPAGGLHELLARIDPEAAGRIHPHDTYRLTRALEVYYLTGETLSSRQGRHRSADRPFRSLVICLRRDAADLKDRIGRRLDQMLAAGFADEVARLLDDGCDPGLPSLRAVGYPQMIRHLQGETSLDEAAAQIRRSTWQYARRQMTWFRGVGDIVWMDADASSKATALGDKVLSLLKREGLLRVRPRGPLPGKSD
jgi:tRNA dimethylallyltransferase